MSDVVIRADKLGKLYQIGEGSTSRSRYKSLRDVLANPFRRRPPTETIWAVRDVSFEIKQGEVVGIIGRNGAGKSTLLKILSRITEPTEGYADIVGRVGSLLEVGTGFHPELTGRENIFLNGAILGMNRIEIANKFDEIVAFAEVEKFIDTPLKHYSSGMAVRLAFAVAAHLEPEILLIDEVLAVGDVAFQNKCLGKIGEVASSGRTILFVSHNLTAISNLCRNVIYLRDGRLTSQSATIDGVLAYTHDVGSPATPLAAVRRGPVTVHEFRICQCATVLDEYDSGEGIEVLIEFELHEAMDRFRLGFFLKTATGEVIARVLLADWEPQHTQLVRGRYQARGHIPAHTLVAGHYLVQVHGSRYGIEDYRLDEVLSHRILVRADGGYNQAHLGERPFGCVLINPHWELTRT